jgi:hypothetical protein
MFVPGTLGKSSVLRILDTRLVTFIQQTAVQLSDPSLKRYPSFRFPGGLPVTLEERHVNTIRAGTYYFTAKADGFRVLVLFFMYYIEGEWRRMCATLQRDGSCHLVSISAPMDANENGGSLFDGEIVDLNTGVSAVILFDCYSYAGQNMRSLPLQRRFSRCETLARTIPHLETDSVRFRAKPYYKLCKKLIPDLTAFLHNKNHYLEYDTDGVVLVPQGRADTVSGRDETQFKLKAHHTVDLIVIRDDEEDNTFYLATYDESDNSYVPKQQIKLEEYGAEENQVFECAVNIVASGVTTYTPIKQRYDKTHPNSELVVERTLKTIVDNVNPECLVIT